MVGVAQLVEPRIVIPVVVGSSPIVHPIFIKYLRVRTNQTRDKREIQSIKKVQEYFIGIYSKLNSHKKAEQPEN